MKIRSWAIMVLAALMMIAFATASEARTFGISGDIGSIDRVNNTMRVGKYEFRVGPSSVLLDQNGHRVSFAMLEEGDGPVTVTMYRVGGRYVLDTLRLEDPDEDG